MNERKTKNSDAKEKVEAVAKKPGKKVIKAENVIAETEIDSSSKTAKKVESSDKKVRKVVAKVKEVVLDEAKKTSSPPAKKSKTSESEVKPKKMATKATSADETKKVVKHVAARRSTASSKNSAPIIETPAPIESIGKPILPAIEKAQIIEDIEFSPAFKKLATPVLPKLNVEKRAFLQIQSPTRLFFYWSLEANAVEKLKKALGARAHEYFPAIRLVNIDANQTESHTVNLRGSFWFNEVKPNTNYRAEAGFAAPNRPFVRLIFSEMVQTPRLNPSSNQAFQPYFAVTASQFADVLDVAGFSDDAFDVYLAGDQPHKADEATQLAFSHLVGNESVDFSMINIDELRYVLFALASGVTLPVLRERISSGFFDFLVGLIQQNDDLLTVEKIESALEHFFGVSKYEKIETSKEIDLSAVYGASRIHFPKTLRNSQKGLGNPRRLSDKKLSPLSSRSYK